MNSIDDCVIGDLEVKPRSILDYIHKLSVHYYHNLNELETDLEDLKDTYHISRRTNWFWDKFYCSRVAIRNSLPTCVALLVLPPPWNYIGSSVAFLGMISSTNKAADKLEEEEKASRIVLRLETKIQEWKEYPLSERIILNRTQDLVQKYFP